MDTFMQCSYGCGHVSATPTWPTLSNCINHHSWLWL